MSATWQSKTSLIVSLPQQKFCIQPWTKVPLWELWDPVPKDLWVTECQPSETSSNRKTDFVSSEAPKPASVLFSPGKH